MTNEPVTQSQSHPVSTGELSPAVPHNAESFWSRVEKTPTCWLWTGATQSQGYGRLKVNGATVGAHRYAFFLRHGRYPVPCGLHKCDNRLCVNPDHIFEGTLSDNNKDRAAKNRSYRPKGSLHPRSKLNDQLVRLILERHQAGESTRKLAGVYGLSRGTVGDIVSGRRWSHLVQ